MEGTMKKLKIVPIISVPDHSDAAGVPALAPQAFFQGLREFVAEFSARLTLYFPGTFIEAAQKACPKDMAWLREQVKEGTLEILGGGFHDALFPLFTQELQAFQFRRHRELLRSGLNYHPRGWFCPSMAWEISLVGPLCSQEFEYSILPELSFAEALSHALPISGWRTVEDDGQVLRIFPMSKTLSDAWTSGDGKLLAANFAELGEVNVGWVFGCQAFPNGWASEATQCFNTLRQCMLECTVAEVELQTWTPSRIIDQTRSSGSISLISTLGSGTGMPQSVQTCRELLNRRPEANFIHKKLLYLHHRAHQVLGTTEALAVDALLLPLMSACFYRNLPGAAGIRGLANRALAHRQLIEAEKALDRLSRRSMRLEVLDFLGDGTRQILASTPEAGFLLDHHRGGVLHSLDFKSLGLNLVNGQLEDGEPSVAFRDHLIPQDHRTFSEIMGGIEDRTGQLLSPFDYQIKRHSDRIQLVMTGEQGVPVQGRAHSLRVVKVLGFKLEDAELQASWQLTNGTFQVARCQFATECVLTFPEENRRKQSLMLDGKRLSWSDVPCVRTGIRDLVFADRALGGRLHVDFVKPAGLVISPVLGTADGAAPDEFQGYRLIFLWDLELKGQESTAFHVRLRMDKRRLFL
jgi:hypothetical protein